MQSWQLFDLLLDTVASPVAPAHWLRRYEPAGGLRRPLFQVAKGLLVVIWAVGFMGIWFLAFWVLLLWNAVANPSRPPPAPEKPAASTEGAAG